MSTPDARDEATRLGRYTNGNLHVDAEQLVRLIHSMAIPEVSEFVTGYNVASLQKALKWLNEYALNLLNSLQILMDLMVLNRLHPQERNLQLEGLEHRFKITSIGTAGTRTRAEFFIVNTLDQLAAAVTVDARCWLACYPQRLFPQIALAERAARLRQMRAANPGRTRFENGGTDDNAIQNATVIFLECFPVENGNESAVQMGQSTHARLFDATGQHLAQSQRIHVAQVIREHSVALPRLLLPLLVLLLFLLLIVLLLLPQLLLLLIYLCFLDATWENV